MDVYKYIRSKDVREYNEKLGHKFNTLESCFLVWRNPDLTLNEKHGAFEQICLEMPDMEISQRNNVDYAESLYELIAEFIATDKFFVKKFFRQENNSVYSYRFYCEGDRDWCENFQTLYSSFGKLKREFKKDFDLPIIAIEYKKQYLNSSENIVISMNKNGKIMDVNSSCFSEEFFDDNYLSDKDNFFEGFFIDVPTPFKVGDIVCSKNTPFGYYKFDCSHPFVVKHMANWDYKTSIERGDRLAKESQDKLLQYHKNYGDATDMTAHGYFLSTDYGDRYTGGFYSECMHDYTDLEYYRGEFVGGERVLLPISYFVKDEINEEEFFKACSIIKNQEEVKWDIRCLGIVDEWVKKLGLK